MGLKEYSFHSMDIPIIFSGPLIICFSVPAINSPVSELLNHWQFSKNIAVNYFNLIFKIYIFQ